MVEYFFSSEGTQQRVPSRHPTVVHIHIGEHIFLYKNINFIKHMIWGKVSRFAQEAPLWLLFPGEEASMTSSRTSERVPFGVDVWGGNWEIHWLSFLVGENNMVTLTPALKLSEASRSYSEHIIHLEIFERYEKWSRREHIAFLRLSIGHSFIYSWISAFVTWPQYWLICL